MAASDQVAVPPQDSVRAHHQMHLRNQLSRDAVQQRGQQRSIARSELHLPRAQLPAQHDGLVTKREDLRVLIPIAHRRQPQ